MALCVVRCNEPCFPSGSTSPASDICALTAIYLDNCVDGELCMPSACTTLRVTANIACGGSSYIENTCLDWAGGLTFSGTSDAGVAWVVVFADATASEDCPNGHRLESATATVDGHTVSWIWNEVAQLYDVTVSDGCLTPCPALGVTAFWSICGFVEETLPEIWLVEVAGMVLNDNSTDPAYACGAAYVCDNGGATTAYINKAHDLSLYAFTLNDCGKVNSVTYYYTPASPTPGVTAHVLVSARVTKCKVGLCAWAYVEESFVGPASVCSGHVEVFWGSCQQPFPYQVGGLASAQFDYPCDNIDLSLLGTGADWGNPSPQGGVGCLGIPDAATITGVLSC